MNQTYTYKIYAPSGPTPDYPKLIETNDVRVFERELEIGKAPLTHVRCPHCGARMLLAAARSPVPTGHEDMLGCVNQLCAGREHFFLPEGRSLVPVRRSEIQRRLGSEANRRRPR